MPGQKSLRTQRGNPEAYREVAENKYALKTDIGAGQRPFTRSCSPLPLQIRHTPLHEVRKPYPAFRMP